MKRKSIIRQAIIAVLLLECLCAVGLVSISVWHEWRSRTRALDIALEGRADSLIGAVQDAEDPEDNVTVNAEEFKAQAGDVFAVFNSTGHLIGASPDLPPQFTAPGNDGFRYARFRDDRFRVLQRQALRIIDRDETHGVGIRRPFTLVYATATNHLWYEILEATRFYLLVSVGLLCATAVVLIWLLRRLLAPLEQLATSASGITTDALAFDPPPGATRVQELVPLVDALSAMVGRVREAFDRQHRFLSDATHELKTAVAVVRSSIQVLAMRPRTAEEYREGLEEVLSDNERVEALVRQMLTLASFDDCKETARGDCNLAEEVRVAAASLGSIAEVHAVSLRCVVDENARVAMAPQAGRTLVSNLVLNALQHSPGGSAVEVRVAVDPTRVMLLVQDSGSGIAAENLDRIFERFFREDTSRSRATGGAGLGLAICRSIVQAAGGEITVDSQPGKGTTVRVALSAVPAAALTQTAPESDRLRSAASR
ncbi:MAG TPA: ATP-binding protein [Terracidiphilus sp.]|jgi:signal transduction histidine kinase